jgi:hypothetical protein
MALRVGRIRVVGAMLVALALLALLVAWLAGWRAQSSRPPGMPQELAQSQAAGIAWIWPDSLGPKTGVPSREGGGPPYQEAAVLVESFVLRAHGIERGARRAPLPLPKGVRVVPVIHVESAPDAPDQFTARQREVLLNAVVRQASTAIRQSGWVQIDFEVPLRQRPAYQSWVKSVREALPPTVKLSVTALAHWCAQGDWLDQLPVDEVVPMLYRLGSDSTRWRQRFADDDRTLARRCRAGALGFATHEPPPSALWARTVRAYWFDENRWGNPSSSQTILGHTPS